MNHYPLPFGRKVPAHGTAGDTADPFSHIDCPKCREMLRNKVSASLAAASETTSLQRRNFFSADAAHWFNVLAA